MSIVIDIIGSFTGKKSFKEADSAVAKLTKSATKLAGSIGVARLAQKSMMDAMADEKGTKILAANLRSLGMAYNQVNAEQFIKKMQDQTGVLDDQLRPAYAQLARVTGDAQKTQELLMTAWNTSQGTGAEFSNVVDALSQAYVGNTKGLKSLNLGLTQTELKGKSFNEILTLLNDQFKNAGAASLDTYAGKLAVLQAHASSASETIGVSLLGALTSASGSTGFEDFISKVDSAAGKLATFITNAGRTVELLKALNPASNAGVNPLDLFKKWAREDLAKRAADYQSTVTMWRPAGYQTPAEKAAAAAAKKRAAEILAASKQQNKLATNNLKLQKAAAVFDMKKIQITAALKSATDEETVTRLKLMLAIENEQVDQAELLQKKLDEIIAKNKTLQTDLDNYKKGLTDLPKVSIFDNTFAPLYQGIKDMDTLTQKVTEVTGVALSGAVAMQSFAQGIASGLSVSAALSGARYAAQGAASTGVTTLTPSGSTNSSTTVNNNITVNGAIDPIGTANAIAEALAQSAASTGAYNNVGYSWAQSIGAAPGSVPA